jgi:ubiquitin-activating enzyme E1
LQLTILTDSTLDEQLEVNEWTRKHGKKMIVVDVRGLFAYIFNDFGTTFAIEDTNGEQPVEVIIIH